MKHTVLIFALVIGLFRNSYSQNDTLKAQKGDWGLSINISGLINNIMIQNPKDGNGNYTLFGRKYLKDDVAVRFGFNINVDNQSWKMEDSITISSGNTALRTIDSSMSRFDFSVIAGYEKHFGKTKRLDPYFAGDIAIGRIGNTKIQADTDIEDVTGKDKTQHIIQYDGGMFFSMGVFAGFNYFIAPKLSLGAEFGYSYQFTNVGGDFNESTVNTPVSGAQTSKFTRGKNEQISNNLNVRSTASIMLSYFF